MTSAGCFVDYDACVDLGKHRVVCGFSWLLRVIDHEVVLTPPLRMPHLRRGPAGLQEPLWPTLPWYTCVSQSWYGS
jgi:hypothetical protein